MHFLPRRFLLSLALVFAVLPVQAQDMPPASIAENGGVSDLLDKGFAYLGIKYRFGGNGPEGGGFDCSGLVRKVFGDALGLNLPRTAAEMAKVGDKVGRQDLQPGDLVFFNTMRRAFSHVGIYVGDNKFLHAPSTGNVVRVEEIDSSYWKKRFNGARRLLPEAEASELPVVSVVPPGMNFGSPAELDR